MHFQEDPGPVFEENLRPENEDVRRIGVGKLVSLWDGIC